MSKSQIRCNPTRISFELRWMLSAQTSESEILLLCIALCCIAYRLHTVSRSQPTAYASKLDDSQKSRVIFPIGYQQPHTPVRRSEPPQFIGGINLALLRGTPYPRRVQIPDFRP